MLVDAFVENRLFVTELADDGSAVVTVAHEALLWHWPRVTDWVAQNRENLRVRGRIAAAAERWDAESKSNDLLLPPGKPLVEAESLLEQGIELPSEEAGFIRASMARERRVQRVRTGAVVGIAALAILAAFFAYFADHQRGLANQARRSAEIEAETAKQTTNFMIGLFNVADPSEARGNSITAREIMDKGAARIDKELTAQPAIQATLMETMGTVYTSLGLYDQAVRLLRSALEKRRALYGEKHLEVARSLDRLGEVLKLKAEYEPAQKMYREALAMRREMLGNENADTARSVYELARPARPHGRFHARPSRCSAKRWHCARSCSGRAQPGSRAEPGRPRAESLRPGLVPGRLPSCCAKPSRCDARSTTGRIRRSPKRSTISAT